MTGGEGGYQTADGLPEFQGPKYAGSFRRGDFADFHQRFSLVPRRCVACPGPVHLTAAGRVGQGSVITSHRPERAC